MYKILSVKKIFKPLKKVNERGKALAAKLSQKMNHPYLFYTTGNP